MMTTNLCTEWGLFNGAMGIIVDIYFDQGHNLASLLWMEKSIQM
jgi:hypothetical protein